MFEEERTGRRRGWYLNCSDMILEVTFVGFECELGIVRLSVDKDS